MDTLNIDYLALAEARIDSGKDFTETNAMLLLTIAQELRLIREALKPDDPWMDHEIPPSSR